MAVDFSMPHGLDKKNLDTVGPYDEFSSGKFTAHSRIMTEADGSLRMCCFRWGPPALALNESSGCSCPWSLLPVYHAVATGPRDTVEMCRMLCKCTVLFGRRAPASMQPLLPCVHTNACSFASGLS